MPYRHAALGRPNFARLHVRFTRPTIIHLWAFDLLAVNGRDLRSRQLVKREECLQILLERFGCSTISLSEPFEDGLALLHVAEERGLEGVVSKWVEARLRQGLQSHNLCVQVALRQRGH